MEDKYFTDLEEELLESDEDKKLLEDIDLDSELESGEEDDDELLKISQFEDEEIE